MALANYVKFTRGTPTAYANLLEKDPDTLYFIAEKEATTGILYLGTKIIAGGSSGTSIGSLKDLEDVLLANEISDNSLLVYDANTSSWVNKTSEEIFNSYTSVMVGATADTDGRSGLVPVPMARQQDMVLKGDGTWSNQVNELSGKIQVLIAQDEDMSTRDIAESVLGTYVGDLDSLKEVVNWVSDNPDFTDFNRRLVTVEGTLFGQGSEATGDFTVGLITEVGDLNIQVSEATQEINNIYERLTWQEIIKSQ